MKADFLIGILWLIGGLLAASEIKAHSFFGELRRSLAGEVVQHSSTVTTKQLRPTRFFRKTIKSFTFRPPPPPMPVVSIGRPRVFFKKELVPPTEVLSMRSVGSISEGRYHQLSSAPSEMSPSSLQNWSFSLRSLLHHPAQMAQIPDAFRGPTIGISVMPSLITESAPKATAFQQWVALAAAALGIGNAGNVEINFQNNGDLYWSTAPQRVRSSVSPPPPPPQ